MLNLLKLHILLLCIKLEVEACLRSVSTETAGVPLSLLRQHLQSRCSLVMETL